MSQSPREKCTRIKKDGDRCGNYPSEGYKVCWKHGAGTKKRVKDGTRQPTGRPMITGRYSNEGLHPRIAAIIAELEQDPDPMSLTAELNAARAIFIDFMRRHETFVVALEAWYQDWQTDPRAAREFKPRQMMDISDAIRILAEVSKIAERIVKMEFIDAIAKRDLGRIMQEMGKVVVKHVPDAAVQEAISNDWREIRI